MSALLLLVAVMASGVCAGAAALVVCGRLAEVSRRGRRARAPSLEEALSDRTLAFALLCSAALLVSAAVSWWVLPPCLLLSWALSRKMPGLMEKRRRRELRSACDGQLDVLEDIVALGVRAGLSFDAALEVYCGKFSGELSREMRHALLSWKNGVVSRERALKDLAGRVESRALRQFAETSLQAIRYGSPLASMLNALAADLRKERRDSIERQVARAPVKMLVPTAVCILPALLILVLGPAVLQFLQAGV